MKALTVRQPFAWAAALNEAAHRRPKNIENRFWATSFRGLLAIHAGVGVGTKAEYQNAVEFVADLLAVSEEAVHAGAQTRGKVLTVVRLDSVCSRSRFRPVTSELTCGCGPWAMAQQHHFHFTDGQPLAEPVPAKGALSLWNLPDEVEAAVLAQLRTGATR